MAFLLTDCIQRKLLKLIQKHQIQVSDFFSAEHGEVLWFLNFHFYINWKFSYEVFEWSSIFVAILSPLWQQGDLCPSTYQTLTAFQCRKHCCYCGIQVKPRRDVSIAWRAALKVQCGLTKLPSCFCFGKIITGWQNYTTGLGCNKNVVWRAKCVLWPFHYPPAVLWTASHLIRFAYSSGPAREFLSVYIKLK